MLRFIMELSSFTCIHVSTKTYLCLLRKKIKNTDGQTACIIDSTESVHAMSAKTYIPFLMQFDFALITGDNVHACACMHQHMFPICSTRG